MKLILQKPILTLTPDEKEALTKTKQILDTLTNYQAHDVDSLLNFYGNRYNEAINAYDLINHLLVVATTSDSV